MASCLQMISKSREKHSIISCLLFCAGEPSQVTRQCAGLGPRPRHPPPHAGEGGGGGGLGVLPGGGAGHHRVGWETGSTAVGLSGQYQGRLACQPSRHHNKVRQLKIIFFSSQAGLARNDFLTQVNGRHVSGLSPEELGRLVRTSGSVLYLDIERSESRSLLYNTGLHQYSYNFLYGDTPNRSLI